MLKTKRCEGVLSRAGGAVEAKRDHTGVFCCIDDAAATVHSPALRCIRPCWHTCSPGGRTIGIWGFGPMEARGLTGRARPLYSAGFATSPSGRCPISPCGGIGRRARLKIEFRKECWFDSGQGHQSAPCYSSSRINFQAAIPVFTSPRLRGEVASILRAGEGESQAGSDPRIVPFTRRLCFAPSPTSPRKRGEVLISVITSGAKQSIEPRSRKLDRFVASAPRDDGNTHLDDPAARCARVVHNPFASENRGRRECRVRDAPAVSRAK